MGARRQSDSFLLSANGGAGWVMTSRLNATRIVSSRLNCQGESSRIWLRELDESFKRQTRARSIGTLTELEYIFHFQHPRNISQPVVINWHFTNVMADCTMHRKGIGRCCKFRCKMKKVTNFATRLRIIWRKIELRGFVHSNFVPVGWTLWLTLKSELSCQATFPP